MKESRDKRQFIGAIGELCIGTTETRSFENAYLNLELRWKAKHRSGDLLPREITEFFEGSPSRLLTISDGIKEVTATEKVWHQRLMDDTYGKGGWGTGE